MQKQNKWALVILIFSLSNCATYHVTTQSLLEQLANNQPETKINSLTVYPYFFFTGVVTGNSLSKIKIDVVDNL